MRGKHKRFAALIASMVLASVVLAACGDDDDDSGGTSGSSTEAASTPAGPPIKVGMTCSCSGPTSTNIALSQEVAEAWESWTNANGGINGHPVEVIIKDDGGDPARSAAGVRELVENDKVVAIAGDNSLVDATWQGYVEQKNFPVVGGAPYQAPFFTSPVFFPSGANILAELYAMLDQAKVDGLTKTGVIYCAEAPVCAQVPPLMEGIGAQAVGGVELVNSSAVSATAPNHTAQCLAAKDADVQGLFSAVESAAGQRIIDECKQQGFEPTILGINASLPVAAAATGEVEGAILAHGMLPPTNTSTPGAQEFADALEEYAPGITESEHWGANPGNTWAGLQLFAVAAEAAKLSPTSTPADVMDGLYSLKDETLGGLTGPLNYTRGQPTFLTCPFVEKAEDGEWVSVNGSEPSCVPEDKVPALLEIAAAAG